MCYLHLVLSGNTFSVSLIISLSVVVNLEVDVSPVQTPTNSDNMTTIHEGSDKGSISTMPAIDPITIAQLLIFLNKFGLSLFSLAVSNFIILSMFKMIY